MEGDFYIRTNSLVNTKVRLKREDKFYEGIVRREGHRFYLVYSKDNEIKIRPTDEVALIGKLEKKLKG